MNAFASIDAAIRKMFLFIKNNFSTHCIVFEFKTAVKNDQIQITVETFNIHIQLRTYTDQYFLIFLKSITLYLIEE
jgi:hypothetical protein